MTPFHALATSSNMALDYLNALLGVLFGWSDHGQGSAWKYNDWLFESVAPTWWLVMWPSFWWTPQHSWYSWLFFSSPMTLLGCQGFRYPESRPVLGVWWRFGWSTLQEWCKRSSVRMLFWDKWLTRWDQKAVSRDITKPGIQMESRAQFCLLLHSFHLRRHDQSRRPRTTYCWGDEASSHNPGKEMLMFREFVEKRFEDYNGIPTRTGRQKKTMEVTKEVVDSDGRKIIPRRLF